MKILAFVVILGLLTWLPAGVLAQQADPPHKFFGTVFLADGSVAPDGTVIAAIVDGEVVVTGIVESSFQPGFYLLDVTPPMGVSFFGLTVSFTIDGKPAAESAVWQTRGADELNLKVSSIAPDLTPPVITLPDGIVVDAETLQGTPITNPDIEAFLEGAAATDDKDPNPVITHDAPVLFPSGSDTVVTFTATDKAGNVSTGTATVTVRAFPDIKAPVLSLPGDIEVAAEKLEGTSITNPDLGAFLQGATATDDQDPNPVITHDAPVLFPSGSDTVVTFTATDKAGNKSTGTATVTVRLFLLDTKVPVLTLPDDIVVDAETPEGTPNTNPEIEAFLNGAAATDDRDSNPVVTQDAPEFFPSGSDTVVTFAATDKAGNQSTGTATVTVLPFAVPVPEIEVKSQVAVDPETTVIVDVQGAQIDLIDAPVVFQQVEERIVLALPVDPGTGKLDSFADPTTGITIVGTQFTIPVRDPQDNVVFTFKGELEAAPEGGQAVAKELRLETAEDVGTVDLTELDPRVGEVTVVLDAQVVRLAEAPVINLDVGTNLAAGTQIAFGQLASQAGRQVSGDVGAVFTVKTNLENADALVTFKIGSQWVREVVLAVTPSGVFDPDDLELINQVIFIGRLPDIGEPQLFDATCTGPSSNGRYACSSNSPAGLSIFGLLALPPVDRPAIPILSLQPPGSITVEVDTLGGATLENAAIQGFLDSATIGEGSAAEVIVIVPDPLPRVFPEGDTLITFAATDSLGNLATDSATITVARTVPPTLQVPGSLVIDSQEPLPASDPRLQTFLGEARAVAVVGGELAVTNDSPMVFPFGDTVVTFTATDTSGNQSTATAIVTVNQVAPDLRVTDVQVVPDRIFGARPVTVIVRVENLGTASGTRRLEIRLDDRVMEPVEVTLTPGESETVTREFVARTLGEHLVRVEGNEVTFQVVAEPVADIKVALQVEPAVAESSEGFRLTLQVENVGEAAGERVLVLLLDGRSLEEVTVSLAAGESDSLDRDLPQGLAAGDHVVEVDGASASFQVAEPASEALAPVAEQPEVTPTLQQTTRPRPTEAAALASTPPGPEEGASDGGGLSGGALAGIVGGVVVLAGLGVGIVLLLRRRASPAVEGKSEA